MSYIFDALRKSENERQREAAASLAHAPLAAARPRTPAWMWIVIGVLSITLAVIGVAWWQNLGETPVGASGPTPLGPAGVSAQPTPADRAAAEATAPAATRTETPQPSTDEVAPSAAETRLRPAAELAGFDASLPEYRLEVLAFSSGDASASSAWINGRRYFAGERVGDGPVVLEIRADGVVLGLAGERFLLTTR